MDTLLTSLLTIIQPFINILIFRPGFKNAGMARLFTAL